MAPSSEPALSPGEPSAPAFPRALIEFGITALAGRSVNGTRKEEQMIASRRKLLLVTAIAALWAAHPLVLHAQYQNLGGAIFSNPSCASPNDFSGEIICAVRGGDNALYGIRFDLFQTHRPATGTWAAAS